MKKLAIVTYIPFWRKDSGNKSRLSAMTAYLAQEMEVIVLFGGQELDYEMQFLSGLPANLRIVFCANDGPPGLLEFGERVAEFLEENPVDCCMIEYVELSFLIDFIPEGIKLLLDTHDISSDRARTFEEFGMGDKTTRMSFEEEIELFLRYDKVILINADDYARISSGIGADRTMLVPHAPAMHAHPHRSVVENIGFVGSDYAPNWDAIVFFAGEVWPHIRRPGLSLHIYGRICDWLDEEFESQPGIKAEGFVADLDEIYSHIDLVISPIRFGAGLKIKNLEALANGLPLITTAHGINGMAEGKDRAFLQADSVDEWIAQVLRLTDDAALRSSLGTEALKFVEERFHPDRCYGELMSYIGNLQLVHC